MSEQLTMGVPRVLTDRELIMEWVRFFGPTTGARLLGWCGLTAVRLPADVEPDEEALIRYGWGAKSTRYRNVAQLRALKADLEARGLTVGEEEAVPAAVRLLGAVT